LAADIGDRLRFADHTTDAEDIAELVRRLRPDVLVLDHIGLVTTDEGGTTETAVLDDALSDLAAALREANTAGIIVAEQNKAALSTRGLALAGIRGSARCASLAGQVLTICPAGDDSEADVTDATPQAVRLTLLKSRHGRAPVAQHAQLWGAMGYWHFEAHVFVPGRRKGDRGNA
jgi:hypothetical protein